jgi:hypothetical protein
MSDKIIDLQKYKNEIERLRREAEETKNEAHRHMMDAVFYWFDLKMPELEKPINRASEAFNELEKKKYLSNQWPPELKNIIIDGMESQGRFLYLYQAMKILNSEGSNWKTGEPLTQEQMEIMSKLNNALI